MKKQAILILQVFISMIHLVAQQQKGQISFNSIPQISMHYLQEYTFDSTTDAAAWQRQPSGLQVSFAATDQLYFRAEVPQLPSKNQSWQATAWKGERINTQILLWSVDTLQQVRVRLHELKNASGKTIPKEQLKVHMVRYVVSNYPYGAKDVTCGESPFKDLYLMPDRFETFDRFELPGKTARPLWFSVDVPATTTAGVYTGILEVISEKGSVPMQLQLMVQDQLLPPPSQWKHRLDLWQNPWVLAWRNRIEPWSDDHKAMLKKHLQLYADAGGKYITTYAVHSPWSDNSYMVEGAMIEWVKKKNGAWHFDYQIFDDYVQLAMDAGIRQAITIYTPVPWGFRFRYLDEGTGDYVYTTWPPDSKAFRDFWNIFLTDLKKHLQQKGWFGKTYLGINENALEHTLAAIRVIKEHSKDWRITYAGDWHPELDGLLDDYSFLYGKESDVAGVQKRTARGQSTTYYVCCNPPVPNNFVFSPPSEGRWLSWYTTAHGYDGFLRWAYDAWPQDPARDARHVLWPAGDCFLVYPGGNSSIRFEKLREGIVDFEKIRILRQQAAASKNKEVQALMRQLDAHLKTLLAEKDFVPEKIVADLQTGTEIMARVTDLLTRVNKPL
jgi:hypothetical protein